MNRPDMRGTPGTKPENENLPHTWSVRQEPFAKKKNEADKLLHEKWDRHTLIHNGGPVPHR